MPKIITNKYNYDDDTMLIVTDTAFIFIYEDEDPDCGTETLVFHDRKFSDVAKTIWLACESPSSTEEEAFRLESEHTRSALYAWNNLIYDKCRNILAECEPDVSNIDKLRNYCDIIMNLAMEVGIEMHRKGWHDCNNAEILKRIMATANIVSAMDPCEEDNVLKVETKRLLIGLVDGGVVKEGK